MGKARQLQISRFLQEIKKKTVPVGKTTSSGQTLERLQSDICTKYLSNYSIARINMTFTRYIHKCGVDSKQPIISSLHLPPGGHINWLCLAHSIETLKHWLKQSWHLPYYYYYSLFFSYSVVNFRKPTSLIWRFLTISAAVIHGGVIHGAVIHGGLFWALGRSRHRINMKHKQHALHHCLIQS